MLEIRGDSRTFCDGVSRRSFIKVGTLGFMGLTLGDLLRIRSAQAGEPAAAGTAPNPAAPNPAAANPAPPGRGTRNRAVILVWMHGGPTQLDTYDPKPEAPSEYRGPYAAIETRVPGIRISERLPLQARVMDRCTVIRSFTHNDGDHFAAAHWLLTGYRGSTAGNKTPQYPAMGSVVAKLLGPNRPDMLPYVNMNDGGFGYHGGAYLGVAYNPFRTGSDSYGNEGEQLAVASAQSFSLAGGISRDRFQDRHGLLMKLDRLRRDIDQKGEMLGMDRFEEQAVEIVLSGRAREAFDLQRESPRVRELYGPSWGEQALLARRLVEAGVTFVTLNTGYWDDHGDIKGAMERKLPRHDRMVAALIEDLSARGMLEDVLIICAGEFGRTPKINPGAGRDHWPQAQSVLLAGGRYRHGQVIGATNSKAEYPTDRPVGPADLCALVYHHLGIDTSQTNLNLSGRPVHVLHGGEVPAELL
jgi:hypothetical protein